MQISAARETLLRPLSRIINAVNRGMGVPVLSHALLRAEGTKLSLTGTDLEVEVTASCPVTVAEGGETTVPARKLFDILKALPDGTQIKLTVAGEKATIQAGRSRFVISTLPAQDFPASDELEVLERITVTEGKLRGLIDRTDYAMARADVRYYLNGMLLDARKGSLSCVATDGHRLAVSQMDVDGVTEGRKVIVPSKGVNELTRLLEQGSEENVELEFGRGHLRVRRGDVVFTTKLTDGKYPDYEAVIPQESQNEAEVDRDAIRGALARAAIVSHERHRSVRLSFSKEGIKISSNNEHQEDAEEEVQGRVTCDPMEIGFNVDYLQQALGALDGDNILFKLGSASQSVLVRETGSIASRHIVMPVRL